MVAHVCLSEHKYSSHDFAYCLGKSITFPIIISHFGFECIVSCSYCTSSFVLNMVNVQLVNNNLNKIIAVDYLMFSLTMHEQ